MDQSELQKKLEDHFNSLQPEELKDSLTQEFKDGLKANAKGLAKVIHDYTTSRTVTVPAGIPVKTEGSAVMQVGETIEPVVIKVD